ncbi:MAG: hypothetical protein U0412_05720 [Nitrospira sp.]
MVVTMSIPRSLGMLLVVLALCVCVFGQMLGAPSTVWNPADSPDLLGSSVLEGFTLVTEVPHVQWAVTRRIVSDGAPGVHVPVLASSLFHPPVV